MKLFTVIQHIAPVVIAAAILISPSQAKNPKPLFSSDEVLKIRIEAPFTELIRKASNATDPYPAILIVEGDNTENHGIMLSARGISRRNKDLCRFPPLRVAFKEKPGGASLFERQKRLKLVTHCRPSKAYQQYTLLEYAAYKLLNALTPQSLNVRMAEIDYIESGSGKIIASRLGFFIEDTDDAAKRNGLKEIDIADIQKAQLKPDMAARLAVFQYMIGNQDWSMHSGPAGRDCCHNTKLLGDSKAAISGIIPVPYDFDYSGLVDAPYAAPPKNVRIRSVRIRRYRGFCDHNALARAEAAKFAEKKQALLGAIDHVPGLSNSNKKQATKYLEGFFKDIASEKKLQSRLLKNCRQ